MVYGLWGFMVNVHQNPIDHSSYSKPLQFPNFAPSRFRRNMTKIKFGTDGWRAIIAKEFTVDNVARVSTATAQWVKANFENPSIVIGHDCRFAGELFAETATKVFVENGIKVKLAKGFVSTPMVSLGNVKLGASLGVVLTASHNPASYHGYKLKGHYGGPLGEEGIQAIEDMIPETNSIELDKIDLAAAEASGLLEYVDLETMYVNHVKANFDLEAIANSDMKLAYDPMYGAGQRVMKRILPNITYHHDEHNPTFHGISPEPILRNLGDFSELIKNSDIECGLATDGDADRIGLFNGSGEFVDSHHILLLLIHYLKHYKKLDGKVATGASTTVKMYDMCKHYDLDLDWVKIGFKHVCEIMINEDVIVGGEESGGIAIKGHIPERDGIWMGLTIWEFMAKSGKTLEQLIDEVYAIVGKFAFERNDLRISQEQKESIVANCRNNHYLKFGEREVQRVDDMDGWKYFLSDSEWVMIRPSGTEPVLRTYAEAGSKEEALAILKDCHETILES